MKVPDDHNEILSKYIDNPEVVSVVHFDERDRYVVRSTDDDFIVEIITAGQFVGFHRIAR